MCRSAKRLYIYLEDKLSNSQQVKDEIIRELTIVDIGIGLQPIDYSDFAHFNNSPYSGVSLQALSFYLKIHLLLHRYDLYPYVP